MQEVGKNPFQFYTEKAAELGIDLSALCDYSSLDVGDHSKSGHQKIQKFDIGKARTNQIKGTYFSKSKTPLWDEKREYIYDVKVSDIKLAPQDITKKISSEEMAKGRDWGEKTQDRLNALGYDGADLGKHEIVIWNTDKIKEIKPIKLEIKPKEVKPKEIPKEKVEPRVAEKAPKRPFPVKRPITGPYAPGVGKAAYPPGRKIVGKLEIEKLPPTKIAKKPWEMTKQEWATSKRLVDSDLGVDKTEAQYNYAHLKLVMEKNGPGTMLYPISSRRIAKSKKLRPLPPYFSGKTKPIQPSSAILRHSSTE